MPNDKFLKKIGLFRNVLLLRTILSIMIGLLCALFAVIASNLLFIIWDWLSGVPDDGSAMGALFSVQRLGLFAVFMALAGVMSLRNLNKDMKDVIVSGVVAGASMAIALLLPLYLLVQDAKNYYDILQMSLPPWLVSSNSDDYVSISLQNLFVQSLPCMLALFVASVAIAGGIAYYLSTPGKDKIPLGKLLQWTIALALSLFVLPPVIASAGVMVGVVPHPTAINYGAEVFNFQNPDGNKTTLNFEVSNSSPGTRYLATGSPYALLIDGKLATNQSIANAGGLNIQVTPSEGLNSTSESVTVSNINGSSSIGFVASFRDGTQRTFVIR